VHRGLVHRYLSMTINYSTKGVARILMVDYVKDIVMAWDKASDGIELDRFKIKEIKQGTNCCALKPVHGE
jgi:hypothetical protein